MNLSGGWSHNTWITNNVCFSRKLLFELKGNPSRHHPPKTGSKEFSASKIIQWGLFAIWQFVSLSHSWGGTFSQCWCVDVVAGESAADCASSHQQISAHVSLQMSHPVSQFRSKILSKQTAPWLYIPQVQHDLSFVWGSSGRNESWMIKLGASASASAFAKTRFASLPLLLQPATICWEITLSINLEMPLLENMFSHAWIYFHKVEFSSHVEAHKLKININKINIKNQRYTLQVVPEYLLKVKRGGLDHHYSTKKVTFFQSFLKYWLKGF